MSTPRRIQRKRTKGWRMPEGAVYVGRPTKWGNPFPIMPGYRGPAKKSLPRRATEAYAAYVASIPGLADAARAELRGRDLCCWCPLDSPCHGDVLLEVANS